MAVVAASLAWAVVGCGESAPEQAAPEAAPQVAPAPEAPTRDVTAPQFAGLESVALAGYEFYALTWQAGSDDQTPPEALRYEVFHVVEPYRELDDTVEPIAMSEPGATSIVLALDAVPGRFYVRAVDEAGNRSTHTVGIAQRSRRPWIRVEDGSALARMTDCIVEDRGEVCVGEDGLAVRWRDDAWRPIALGTAAAMQIAETLAGTFLYSEVGHLFTLDGDEATLIDLRFLGEPPTLPFRQFTADDLGLRYWIDGAGRLYVGADREFRSTTRPLALAEGDACASLRGIGFTAAAGFALCEDGTAYSSNHARAGRTWQSLTPNADFPLAGGIRQVYADADNAAIVGDALGIRRVGVGGWSPLLLTEYPDTVHPLDIPSDGPRPSRMGRMLTTDDAFYAVSDLGLLERRGSGWRVVDDTEGPLVGASESGRSWTLFYEDGAVASVRNRRTWVQPPRAADVRFTDVLADGTRVVVRDGEASGLWTLSGGSWERISREGLPSDGQVLGLRGPADRPIAYGTRGDVGEIWTLTAAGWRRATRRVLLPPEPPDAASAPTEPALGPDGLPVPPTPAPPPPLAHRAMTPAEAEASALPPIVDADADATGRGVAISAHEVWWRDDGGWMRLTTRPGTLSAVALDVGETYVLVENGETIRCWRDVCGAGVVESGTPPADVVRTWRAPHGLVAMASNGATRVFEPGSAPPEAQALWIDPASEAPAGGWVGEGDALPASMVDEVIQRLTTDAHDVLWLSDGSLLTHDGERWAMQGTRDDVLSLLAARSDWAVLTGVGTLKLDDVATRTRPQPAPEPPMAGGAGNGSGAGSSAPGTP